MQATPPPIDFNAMPIFEAINDYIPFVSQIFASPAAIAVSVALVGLLFAAMVGAFYWYQHRNDS